MEMSAIEIIDKLTESANVEEGKFEDVESSELYVGQLTYKLISSLERLFNKRRDPEERGYRNGRCRRYEEERLRYRKG